MEWLNEPNAEGWWWVITENGDQFPADRLLVVYVYKEEDYDPDYTDPRTGLPMTPFGVYVRNFVGYTGEYTGDVVGKWYGPIPLPVDGMNTSPF